MLAATSSLGSRAFVIGVSALLHVAVLATAGRGSEKGGDLATDETPLVEITTEDVHVDEAAEHEAAEHAAAPAHAHHHHDYPVAPDHDLVDHDPSIVHTPYAAHEHEHDRADHDRDHDLDPRGAVSDPMPAPASLAAPESSPAPVFKISIGGGSTPHGVVATNGVSARPSSVVAPSANVTEAPLAESDVSSRATLLAGGAPPYPADAREAGIEADVPLEIVVDAAGHVTAARALDHVGYGLDEAALGAVRRYRFTPAQRGGRAVAVRMRWVVEFRLK